MLLAPSHPEHPSITQLSCSRIMEFSEARTLTISNNSVRVFRISGEDAWRCLLSEIPRHQLLESRQGEALVSHRTYASDRFLDVFCDEAGLINRPHDDDIYVVTVDLLRNFEPDLLYNSILLWSNAPAPDISLAPAAHTPSRNTRTSTALTPEEFLFSMPLDFTAPLTLPNGDRPSFSIRNWNYGLKESNLCHGQKELLRALTLVFRSPASTHKPISPSNVGNVKETLLKLWGLCMNHLGFTQHDTTTLKILSPHCISFYFRFLANEEDGRNLAATTLETERQNMRHLVQGLWTLSLQDRDSGLAVADIIAYAPTDDVPVPEGLTFLHIERFVSFHIKRSLNWAPNKGVRKRERVDISLTVSNDTFIQWGDKIQHQAKQIQASSGPQAARTEQRAKTTQDLLIQGLLGALFPPQRSDVLKSLVVGPNGGRCAMPECHMATCRGNRILTRSEYEHEYGSTSRQDHQCEYEYFIVVAHAKNYANQIRARFRGPTVHTPENLGPTVQFLLHEIVTWSGGLLRDIHGDNEDEQSSGQEEEPRDNNPRYAKHAFVAYDTGGQWDRDGIKFNRYVQRITSPEVGLPPCNFRFLFVRKVEIQISQDHADLTVSEADSIRSELAHQMLTSLETWKKTYAMPAPSLPQPGHRKARALAFGEA